jgi:hypothetical protein
MKKILIVTLRQPIKDGHGKELQTFEVGYDKVSSSLHISGCVEFFLEDGQELNINRNNILSIVKKMPDGK